MSAALRPPMAGARLWSAVMDRASQGQRSARCECTGQCGKHDVRCIHAEGEHRRRGGPLRLVAAPADLTLDGTPAAARLGADELLAWCPRCQDGAHQVLRKAPDPSATMEGLF